MAAAEDDTALPITVMFADMSGSTMLYAVHGDAAAFRLTSLCLELMEDHVCSAGGWVLKRLGDGVLGVFETSAQALDAVVGIQLALAEPGSSLQAKGGICVRAGISRGAVVGHKGDVYGDVVNVAARLVSIAKSNEIVLSGAAYEELPAPFARALASSTRSPSRTARRPFSYTNICRCRTA